MQLPQRHCLILQGDSDWLQQQAVQVYEKADKTKRCWLSEHPDRTEDCISSKQALQHLGRSNQLIIFDGRDKFSADAFGALIGTLSAGGWLLVLLPEVLPDSLWLQRFFKISERYSVVRRIKQGETLPEIKVTETTSVADITPTPEQQKAIESVLHVVSGHRRRPLVIASDRGRGKTALLGMAAAELLRQGKSRVLVTAPSVSNIDTLMEHASRLLSDAKRSQHTLIWQQSEIRFAAPDALLAEKPAADLLIVDEAAAIPAQMLEAMLQHYSRVVFASTEHGYEGTGRGFAVRFKKTLDNLTPNWRQIRLTQPVRWAEGDRLEAFSFDALLLDAEPVNADQLPAESVSQAEFAMLSKQQLASDETLLREVFGLMVLAHYRTRPSDLQMLLDRDDISLLVLQAQGHVIACAWLMDEAALDDRLAQQVFNGRRRLKGQLLPQTLLAHSGVMNAGRCHYQRIIRIAVHPALQGQGLGSRLLQGIERYSAGRCDALGTSFALDSRLLQFWLNNGYVPVRVGQQADEVSGQRAGILLKALNARAEAVVRQARHGFASAWPYLLLQSHRRLDARLVSPLSRNLPLDLPQKRDDDLQALNTFAFELRPFESTEPLLWQWLHQQISVGALDKLPAGEQAVLIKKILQGQSFPEVAAALQLDGRKAIIERCRQAVATLIKKGSE
jgi:tRNA(Met) cytidine acetyltransferase